MDSTTTTPRCSTRSDATKSRTGIFSTEKAAKEIGVDLRWALWCRINFLKEEIRRLGEEVEDLVGGDDENPDTMAINNSIATERLVTMLALTKEMKACEKRIKDVDKRRVGEVTDEMIERARAYPIDRLITFTRGAALAWCHADKTPSLTWDRQRNRARCWPCNRSFDSIAVLMERDLMSFKDAVKALAS